MLGVDWCGQRRQIVTLLLFCLSVLACVTSTIFCSFQDKGFVLSDIGVAPWNFFFPSSCVLLDVPSSPILPCSMEWILSWSMSNHIVTVICCFSMALSRAYFILHFLWIGQYSWTIIHIIRRSLIRLVAFSLTRVGSSSWSALVILSIAELQRIPIWLGWVLVYVELVNNDLMSASLCEK